MPIPFDTMIDPETGRTRVRSVDVSSTRYAIARRYMIRLQARGLRRSARSREAGGDRALRRSESSASSSRYLTDDEPEPLIAPPGGPALA